LRDVGELTPFCHDLWLWRLEPEMVPPVAKLLKTAEATIVTF